MNNKIKKLLNKFSSWLWFKTHVMTATEYMILKGAEEPRKCEHCGLSPIHYIDKKCCNHIISYKRLLKRVDRYRYNFKNSTRKVQKDIKLNI